MAVRTLRVLGFLTRSSSAQSFETWPLSVLVVLARFVGCITAIGADPRATLVAPAANAIVVPTARSTGEQPRGRSGRDGEGHLRLCASMRCSNE